jgi:hypothetical protein
MDIYLIISVILLASWWDRDRRMSGVDTTCFSSCCDKDLAIVFTTGRLPDVDLLIHLLLYQYCHKSPPLPKNSLFKSLTVGGGFFTGQHHHPNVPTAEARTFLMDYT